MKHEDYDYFVLKRGNNPSYSFNGYSDKTTGLLQGIYTGKKDKEGNFIPKRFRFDEAHRALRVHKEARSKVATITQDEKGKDVKTYLKESDFVRNYPFCKGSENISSEDAWIFSEVKETEDAITAIEAKAVQVEALTKALNLEGKDLKEMGALYGCFIDDDQRVKHLLMEKAGSEPSVFLAKFNSPRRSAESLLIKAKSLGVVEQIGSLYSWGAEALGATEDLAISRLMTDNRVAESLRETVKAENKK